MKCLNKKGFWTLQSFSALIILVNVISGRVTASSVNEEILKANSNILSRVDEFHSAHLYNKLNREYGRKIQPISDYISSNNVSSALYQRKLEDDNSLQSNTVNSTFDGSSKGNDNDRTQNFSFHDQRNNIDLPVKSQTSGEYKNKTNLRANYKALARRSLNTRESEYLAEATNVDAQYQLVPKRIYIKHKGTASNPEYKPKSLVRTIPTRKSRKIDRSLNVAVPVDEAHSVSELFHIESQQHPRNSHSQIPPPKKKTKKRRKRPFKGKGRKNKLPDESKLGTSKSNESGGFKLEEIAKNQSPKSNLEGLAVVTDSHGISSEDPSLPKDDSKSIDYYSILFGDHTNEDKISSKESKEFSPSTFQYDAHLYRQKPLHKLFGPPYDHYRFNYFPHHHSSPKTTEGEHFHEDVLLPPESVFQSTFYFSTPAPPTAVTVPSSFDSMSTPRVYSHRSQSLVATSHSLQSPFDSPIPLIPYIPDFNRLSKISDHSHPTQDQRPSIFVKTDAEDSFGNSIESQKSHHKNINDEEEIYFKQDFGHHENLQIEKIFKEKAHDDVINIGKSISHHRKHRVFNRKQLKTYQENIPRTSFSCIGRPPGMYADVEAECQVWHTCESDFRHHTFSCPNGTTFSQKLLTCDWWYNVKCEDSEQYLKIGPSAEVFKDTVKNDDRDKNIDDEGIRGKSLKQTSRGRTKNKIIPPENAVEENLAATQKTASELEKIKNDDESEKFNVEDETENINSEEEKIPEIEKPKVDIKNTKSKEEGIYFPQVVPLMPQSAVLESNQELPFNQNKPKLTPKLVEFIPYTGNSYPLFRLLKPGERRFLSKRQIIKA